eukprot:CAMPEP_0201283984 /NCGR_PEP_ID=MMETSP1317-20130820/57407_1 /ASSEMBLY_ACC=CAM_ASM_000770 /TAXON_ID=187299 /ORGANISM="Undescribed Undescribed, Strain Undescribed" /LENGTH=107 /DNA_ID=CAMNT_0047602247 /DNA_START=525 /DNA_END=848 /DNA_ORIENTATION=-
MEQLLMHDQEDELMSATPTSPKMSSVITRQEEESSFFNEESYVFQEIMNNEETDEYEDDDDLGYEVYNVNEETFVQTSKEIAEKQNFPARACAQKKPPDPRISLSTE